LRLRHVAAQHERVGSAARVVDWKCQRAAPPRVATSVFFAQRQRRFVAKNRQRLARLANREAIARGETRDKKFGGTPKRHSFVGVTPAMVLPPWGMAHWGMRHGAWGMGHGE